MSRTEYNVNRSEQLHNNINISFFVWVIIGSFYKAMAGKVMTHQVTP